MSNPSIERRPMRKSKAQGRPEFAPVLPLNIERRIGTGEYIIVDAKDTTLAVCPDADRAAYIMQALTGGEA